MTELHAGEIIGISEAARALREFVSSAARQSGPVILTGEPGTGKELAAKLIHEQSDRRRAPFLMIDCSLYYERELKRELFGYHCDNAKDRSRKGLLEFAGGGTCYLSRVEELSPAIQRQLLRFLRVGCFCRLGDGKEVASGARLIASSDKNLQGLVDAGLFDAEFYGELSKLGARLAPLRDRTEDIPAFVSFLVARFAAEHAMLSVRIGDDALGAFRVYPWPSNFDDLRKEIERLLASGQADVRCENLAMEISSYWLGQRGDPEIRRVLEELDGHIREFRILSGIEVALGEPPPELDRLGLGARDSYMDFVE